MRRAAAVVWVLAVVAGLGVIIGSPASAAPQRPTLPLTGLAIAASDGYNCAIRPDGSVDCWGEPAADLGQVRDRAVGDSPFVQVDSAEEHTCGVRANGEVDCWGDNWNGRATDQTPYDESDRFVKVAVGYEHTCALDVGGSIWCWGKPWEDLGDPDGTFYGRPMPLMDVVENYNAPYSEVSSGWNHTCGLRAHVGAIDCWGENGSGQAMSQPAGDNPFVGVSAGGNHSCGLRTDGSVTCWGDLAQGRPAGDNPFTQVTAGDDFACGLREDRSVACWGSNAWAEEVEDWPPPYNEDFIQISAGDGHVCGIKRAGDVFCFGFSVGGQSDPQPGPYAGYEAQFAGITAIPGPEPTTHGTARAVDVEVVDQAGYAMVNRKVRSSAGEPALVTDSEGIAHFSQTLDSAYYYLDVDGLPGYDGEAGDLRTEDVLRTSGSAASLEIAGVEGSQADPVTAGGVTTVQVCAVEGEDPLPGAVLDAILTRGFFVDDQGDAVGDEVSVVTDGSGCADVQASIGRDTGFDDDGRVQSLVRVFGVGERAAADLHWTSEDPLEGGTVRLTSPATRVVGQQAGLGVAVTDGFGNRVGGETVSLAGSGVGSVSTGSVISGYGSAGDATASTQSAGTQTVQATWSSPSGARGDSTEIEWGRQQIQAILSGAGNGKRADVLTVEAPDSAAGATVKLFKVSATGKRLLKTKVLDSSGDLTVTQKDGNGRRFTTYVASVLPTAATGGTTTNQVKRR